MRTKYLIGLHRLIEPHLRAKKEITTFNQHSPSQEYKWEKNIFLVGLSYYMILKIAPTCDYCSSTV